MPYLDQAGLTAFWGKVKNWVAAKSASTMAKGTASTDGIPLTMSNGAETPVVLSTVKITKDDIAATGAKVTDTVYEHPKSAAGAKASGLYKVATDATGHVTAATAVEKSDITALGIPGSDTTYAHPAGGAASKAAGLYKFSTDSTSHIASVAAVTKADIAALESDPTVPAWAKASSKPSYDMSEILVEAGHSYTLLEKINSIEDDTSDLSEQVENNANAIAGKQDKLTDSDKQAIADLHKDKVTSVNGKTGAVSLDIPNVEQNPGGQVYRINDAPISATYDFLGQSITETYATKAALSGKQDAISDLATIRAGAAKGATALQSETDPTVPAWAKAASKPAYKADEIELGDESAPWFDDGASVDEAVNYLMGKDDTLERDIASLSSGKAPIASPTLTGTPKAPTAAVGTNTTQIATCAFVSTAVANAVTGAAKYKGGITPTTYAALKAYEQGWYWVVTTAGSIAGETCEVGDMVFCNATKSGLTAPAAADFDVVQNNITAIPDSVINGLS